MSSTEAEYITLSESTKKAIHLRRFLSEVLDQPSTTIIFNYIKVEYLPTDQMPADSYCVLTARHFFEIDNVHLRSQHTQDFFYNRNYDYYILFYLDQINVILM
jgi:hypothetical protein